MRSVIAAFSLLCVLTACSPRQSATPAAPLVPAPVARPADTIAVSQSSASAGMQASSHSELGMSQQVQAEGMIQTKVGTMPVRDAFVTWDRTSHTLRVRLFASPLLPSEYEMLPHAADSISIRRGEMWAYFEFSFGGDELRLSTLETCKLQTGNVLSAEEALAMQKIAPAVNALPTKNDTIRSDCGAGAWDSFFDIETLSYGADGTLDLAVRSSDTVRAENEWDVRLRVLDLAL